MPLHKGEHVEVERLDGEFATLLGKEGASADFCHHVTAAVDGLLILLHVALLGEVLAPEAFVAGQFVDLVLLERDLGIDLVGEDDLLTLLQCLAYAC